MSAVIIEWNKNVSMETKWNINGSNVLETFLDILICHCTDETFQIYFLYIFYLYKYKIYDFSPFRNFNSNK